MKASELPINTFIETPNGITWSRQEGCYKEVYPHCVDCADAIVDDLERTQEFRERYANVVFGKSTDDYFTEFKIIAYPVGVSTKLAFALAQQSAGMVDHQSLIDLMIEELRRETNSDN